MSNKFSEIAKLILEERYYLRDENKNLIEKTPEELFHRVADFIAQAEKKFPNGDYEKYRNIFYEIMINQEFMPASPILFNAGTNFPMLSSCFALPVHDNMQSILKTLSDSAMIFKYGGGVGWNFSELRPENSPLSSGGTSSGPCAFISLYNEVIEAIKQGGKRRGAGAAILDIEHPDVEKFIMKKRTDGVWNNVNISVICSNDFMDRVFSGEKKATYLWDMIAESNWSAGDPNIIFIDNMNKYNTIPKYPISTVNPCLPGWTIVLTKNGPKKLKDLKIGEKVWSEDGWVEVLNVINQGVKKVYKYETICGDIYATDNHKIKTMGFKEEIKNAKTIDLLKSPIFPNVICEDIDINLNDLSISLHEDPEVFSEQIVSMPLNILYNFVRGLLNTTEFCVYRNSEITLFAVNRDKQCVKNLQLLLSIFGIDTFIMEPVNDITKILYSEYDKYMIIFKDIIDLISTFHLHIDLLTKDDIKRITQSEEKYEAEKYLNDIKTSEILSYQFYSTEEVFDITVSGENHTFWANGFNVSNCHEICMSPYESCNLSGINLDKVLKGRKGNMKVDWDKLGKLIKIGHRFLDNNIEMCFYPIPEIEDFAKKTRRQGLYFFGLAPFLIKLGLRYGSQESLDMIDNLFCYINRVSLESTIELGKERGNFPEFENSIFKGKYKYMRSSNRLTIAPSGTTSRIADSYFSIEPYFAWEYDSKIMGKVIHEKFDIYDEYKDIYPEALVTAHDITPEEHLRVMATIGKWIDQSISKCISLDTRVNTNKGIKKLKSLSENREIDTFKDIEGIEVDTRKGIKKVKSFYYNGETRGKEIITRNGFSIKGTPNHRILCLNDNFEEEFKRLDQIKKGDIAIIQLDNNIIGDKKIKISDVIGKDFYFSNKNEKFKTPEYISDDLMKWLGLMQTNSLFLNDRVMVEYLNDELIEEFISLTEKIFNVDSFLINRIRDNLKYVNIESVALINWLRYIKFSSNEITPIVWHSNKNNLKSFLEGVSVGGYVDLKENIICLNKNSKKNIIKDLQLLASSIGIPTFINVKFNEEHKRFHYELCVQEDGINILKDMDFCFADSSEKEFIKSLFFVHPKVKTFILRNTTMELESNSRIIKILDDIKNKMYNSEFMDFYYDSKEFIRKIKKDKMINIESFLFYCSFVNAGPDWINKNYLLTEVIGVNDVFIETGDIEVEDEHNYVANGFISHNTVNCPNESTISDISKIMKLAFKFGLKAIAIFRDGCKSEQVLNTKKERKKFNVSRNELIEMYLKNQMTQQEIAEKYNVSQSLVALRLKEFEIPRRTGRSKKTQEVPDIETIEFLMNKGIEVDEISKFFNVKEKVIQDIIDCNKNEDINLTRSIPINHLLAELIEGELLGRGELIEDPTKEKTAYFKYSSNDYDYVCWLDRVLSSERLIKVGNIEETDGIFYAKTISCSELYDMYSRWYSNGKKKIPDDFKLTPNILRQWFISDLTIKENGHLISFNMENFKKKGIDKIKNIFGELDINFEFMEDERKLAISDQKSVNKFMKYIDESIFEVEKSKQPIQCKNGRCQI